MRINSVRAVHDAALRALVHPGVTRNQLNHYIRDSGLFFPIDPGADASIGGMTSTRASGTNAVRYGTMRENVLALQVVAADGRLMRLGRRSRKSSAGDDLVKLFVGSEGTLGIITEITLRLYGIPESMAAATCAFESLEGAVNTVIQTIQSGIPVARIELMDTETVATVNSYSKLDLPARNLLLLEFHGTEASTREQAEMVQAIAAENGGGDFAWTSQAEERTRMWQARHDAAWAAKAARPGWGMWATDVCVPISRLAECILETQKDIQRNGLYAPIVGHVGDGNFHLTMMVNPEDPTYLPRAEALNDRMVARALGLGGTCTGEHGVGMGKIKFLYDEHGEAMSLMRSIKQALDPDNIMNPGKIIGPIT
jgi:D-lactate dehydrogenase (cytochrome)